MQNEVASIAELDALASEVQAEQPIEQQPAAEEAAPQISTAEIIKPVLQLGFGIAAPAWKMSDAEIDALANAYGPLLDKYFPDGILNRFGVEITAIAVTVAVIGPRVNQPRKVEPEKTEPLPKAA